MKKNFYKTAVILLAGVLSANSILAKSMINTAPHFYFENIQAKDFPATVIDANGRVIDLQQFDSLMKKKMKKVNAELSASNAMGVVNFSGFNFNNVNGARAFRKGIINNISKRSLSHMHYIAMIRDGINNDEANKILTYLSKQKSNTGISLDLSDNPLTDTGSFYFGKAAAPAVVYFREDNLTASAMKHILSGGLAETAITLDNSAVAQAYHDYLSVFAKGDAYRVQVMLTSHLTDADLNKVIDAPGGNQIGNLIYDFNGRTIADSTINALTAIIAESQMRAIQVDNAIFASDNDVKNIVQAVSASHLTNFSLTDSKLINKGFAVTDFSPLADDFKLQSLNLGGSQFTGTANNLFKALFSSEELKMDNLNLIKTNLATANIWQDIKPYLQNGCVHTVIFTPTIANNYQGFYTNTDSAIRIVSDSAASLKAASTNIEMGAIEPYIQCSGCHSTAAGAEAEMLRIPNVISVSPYTVQFATRGGQTDSQKLRETFSAALALAQIKYSERAGKTAINISTPLTRENLHTLEAGLMQYQSTGLRYVNVYPMALGQGTATVDEYNRFGQRTGLNINFIDG